MNKKCPTRFLSFDLCNLVFYPYRPNFEFDLNFIETNILIQFYIDHVINDLLDIYPLSLRFDLKCMTLVSTVN